MMMDDTNESTDMMMMDEAEESTTADSDEEMDPMYECEPEYSTLVYGSVFSIVHINIRSIRKNFDQLLLFFVEKQKWPSIIILSEVWAFDEEIEHYNISGYATMKKCNQDYRSGGVVIYYKQEIRVKQLENNFRSADVISGTFELGNTAIQIVGIYRLQRHSPSVFNNELRLFLARQRAQNLAVIGDVNIDILGSNEDTCTYRQIMSANGLQPFVEVPTRVFNLSATCIDHAFVRLRPHCKVQAKVSDVEITDHKMIEINLHSNVQTANQPNLKQGHPRLDNEQFFMNVRESGLEDLLSITEVDEAAATLVSRLKNSISISTQHIQRSNKALRPSGKPWMSPALFQLVKNKYKLIRMKKQRPFDMAIKTKIKALTDEIKVRITTEKSRYYNTKFAAASGDSKTQWKIIHEISGSSRRPVSIELENSNGNLITDPQPLATHLNNYFVSQPLLIVENLLTEIGSNNCPGYLSFLPEPKPNSIFLFPATYDEVVKAIKKLKNNRAPGKDSIKNEQLKQVAELIAPAVTNVFNLSLEQGKFPESFKETIVVPVPKKGNSRLAEGYRGVSLLNNLAKLNEALMGIRLTQFLEDTNFFSPNQFGFRQGKSTEEALSVLTRHVFDGINSGRKVALKMIDIQRAFDCCDQKILLDKLDRAGIRGIANQWFKSYFSHRKQQVRMKDFRKGTEGISESLNIDIGIFQGSCLGPVLFLIYINDLCDSKKLKGKVIGFADDLGLVYVADSWEEVWSQMTHDMIVLRQWFAANLLSLNVSKTCYILFSLRGEETFNRPVQYHSLNCINNGFSTSNCNCSVVKQVHSAKYLGLHIDSKLNWESHIMALKKFSFFFLRKMYYLRPICSDEVVKLVYKSLFESRVSYALGIWGGTYKTNIKPVEKALKFAVRIMAEKNRRHPSYELFTHFKCLPFRQLYVLKVLRLFYKVSGSFRKVPEGGTTRSSTRDMYEVPRPNITAYKKSFSYMAPALFNDLPEDLKQSSSRRFSSKVFKLLLNTENLQVVFKCLR